MSDLADAADGRHRTLVFVRATGHVAWWIFVLSAVFTVPALGATVMMPRRYADYLPSDGADLGWTAYTPLHGELMLSSSAFSVSNTFATLALVALGVVVLAAVAEAIVGGRWGTGIATVAAPVIGAVLVYLGVNGGWGGVFLRPELVFALVLAGVAIREVWSRALAPTRA
ncbi:MAG: hypothetical protein QM774_05635 [Gordonia sp. (in: high G+C Gram-positive bacteria)]|uniref:hypothetical protein n=1 Tax=Gordonia sp. (in: high G+C Gram-positive bacteria) TaxID=84139 RepID=UPI0039E2CCD2